MENIMVKGINWVKGFALLGMMVALVGMLAVAPGASAASASLSAVPVPISNPGKISIFAHQGSSSVIGVADATVAVYRVDSDVIVLKGSTDKSGRFSNYIPVGTYQLSITAKGYKEYSQFVKIAPGQNTLVTAALDADPTPDPRPTDY